MCYVLYEDDRHIGSFVIAVHATPPERTAWNRVFRVARGADARAAERLVDLGDDRVVWPGRVRVLRRNVTFEVEVNASWERTLSIARAIDDAIQNDPAIAPKGSFEETPRIESAGAPAEVEPLETPAHVSVVTSWATLRPVFKGLGDLEKLHVLVDGLHFSNLVTSVEHSRLIKVQTRVHSMETWMDPRPTDTRRLRPDEDGRFYLIPKQGTEPGTVHKLTMFVGNEDNVFVTKKFEVRVAERP